MNKLNDLMNTIIISVDLFSKNLSEIKSLDDIDMELLQTLFHLKICHLNIFETLLRHEQSEIAFSWLRDKYLYEGVPLYHYSNHSISDLAMFFDDIVEILNKETLIDFIKSCELDLDDIARGTNELTDAIEFTFELDEGEGGIWLDKNIIRNSS